MKFALFCLAVIFSPVLVEVVVSHWWLLAPTLILSALLARTIFKTIVSEYAEALRKGNK